MNDKQTAIIAVLRSVLDGAHVAEAAAEPDDGIDVDDSVDEVSGDDFLRQMNDDALARLVFYSYLGPGIGGGSKLRLTKFGLEILGRAYESYEINFTKGYVFNTNALRVVEQMCRMPYWLDTKVPRLITFDREFAAHANLVHGDITLMRHTTPFS